MTRRTSEKVTKLQIVQLTTLCDDMGAQMKRKGQLVLLKE